MINSYTCGVCQEDFCEHCEPSLRCYVCGSQICKDCDYFKDSFELNAICKKCIEKQPKDVRIEWEKKKDQKGKGLEVKKLSSSQLEERFPFLRFLEKKSNLKGRNNNNGK